MDSLELEPQALEQRAPARRWAGWGALLLILVLTAGLRARLLDVPLERDEGEYAYAAQLILQGIPPYQLVYSMKLPGIYGAYAVVLALFGQTHTGIHLALLLVNAATVVLIFLLARRLFDEITGLVAAASFALLSIGPGVQGLFANAEHFVILPAVAGLVLLLRGVQTDRAAPIGLSGLLLGLALLVKQHGAPFAAFGGIYLLMVEVQRRPLDWRRAVSRGALFGVAVAAPYLLTCTVLWTAGVFDRFWFWTVTYARSYTGLVPLEQGLARLVRSGSAIVRTAPLLWVLAALGLSATVWDRRVRERGAFVVLFSLFSFLAVCLGFYFRPHYFVLALPAAALLVACGFRGAADLLARTRLAGASEGVGIALAGIVLAVSVAQQREFLFTMTPVEVTQTIYRGNPFAESVEIARFIKERANGDSRIAVIGSEPQIYFYTRLRSATGYVYAYPLMEPHPFALEMQEDMIDEIESNDPDFVVFVNVPISWLPRPGSHPRILQWFEQYRGNLNLVAVAEVGGNGVRLLEGDQATRRGRHPPSIEIYQRRSEG